MNNITLNRNDLCNCGSGKKYKHCHLDEDLKAEAGKPKEEKPKGKAGTISIKSGRILTYDENEKETEICISSVKDDMKEAIVATDRNSLYVQSVREWVEDLTYGGLRAIPEVQKKLRFFLGKPEEKGFSFGGRDKSIKPDHRTNILSSGDNSFLRSTFAIAVGKPSKHKDGKHLGLGTELTAKQCFSTWYSQLNMIRFQGSSKKKPYEDPDKPFKDNWEKTFKAPEIQPEQKAA